MVVTILIPPKELISERKSCLAFGGVGFQNNERSRLRHQKGKHVSSVNFIRTANYVSSKVCPVLKKLA